MTPEAQDHLISLIKAGQKLPKEYIYQLFADEEDVSKVGGCEHLKIRHS